MSYKSVPHSISLIFSICSLLDENSTVLSKSHKDYELFQDVLDSSVCFNDRSDFIKNEAAVGHLQLLMLSGLSMYGGVLIPVMRQFSFEEGVFRIVWDSGSVDQFTFKVWDDKFLKFAKYYVDRLSSKPQSSSEIKTTIVGGISQYLKSYLIILRACEKRVTLLMKSKGDILFFLKENRDKDLFFILLSSLPPTQMNSLFIFIQQFFPRDLEVPTPDGMKVNVCATFETPATDVTFLIEKTRIYLDLYFNKKFPIIQEITKSKTMEFMTKLLNNNDVYKETNKNLGTLKKAQLEMRLTLYKALSTHLGSLLNETTTVS
jgi:hypothetical protein